MIYMGCLDEDRWLAFLRGDILSKENDEMAEHLYSCERCLELYSNCAENNLIETDDDYADDVLSKLKRKNKDEHMKNFIKYVIAASLTLVLYSTGVFDEMILISERFSKEIVVLNSRLNNINIDINLNDIWRSIYEKK